MVEDARFEDGGERPLRLLAMDAEDLGVISALTQDAVFPITEMTWQPQRRRFALGDRAGFHFRQPRRQRRRRFVGLAGFIGVRGLDGERQLQPRQQLATEWRSGSENQTTAIGQGFGHGGSVVNRLEI